MYENLMLMLDGSYTWNKNGLPYNCPNFGEWEEEFAEVDAWAKANPELVQHEETPPAPTLDDLKAQKKRDIAAARYEYEIAGVVYNNIRVTSDREDQSMITAVALSAVVDPTYTTVWKGADGYLDLDAVGVLTLARMVGAHVEAAFAEEKRLVELIDAAQDEAELASISWTLT